MKRICIIMPGKLPIPNIMGGAIETLMTLLLDENEKEQKAYFIVISAWADGVEEASKTYQYAEFHYIKAQNVFLKKTVNYINYLIARSIGTIDFFSTPFHQDVRKLIKGIHADAVVVEHGVYKHFDFLQDFYDRDQLYLHFHGIGPIPDKKTCNTFGHIITVSEFVKKFYEPMFKDYRVSFHVCLNGINKNIFMKRLNETERECIRKTYGVRKDDFLIVYCGRLVKEKGVKELMEAVISIDDPRVKLMLIGSSNFKNARTTKYIYKLQHLRKGNEDKILLTGYVANEELYKYYQLADIQIVCSICEDAAPLANIEGMMSGLPLIVTDSGGILEYTGNECCKVVNKYNSFHNTKDAKKLSYELARVICYLMSHENKLADMKENSVKRGCNFTGEKFYRRFLHILE